MRKIAFTETGAVVIDGEVAGLVPTDLTNEEVASLLYEAQTTIVRARVNGRAQGELDAGVQLRDQFAMAALSQRAKIREGNNPERVAKFAYMIADAMLAVRGEGGAL